MKDKLHLGCGDDIMEGYINLDIKKYPGIDVEWNLDKFPYPFPDNTFSEVIILHVLEHLQDRVKVMEEIWRICKPGAIVKIAVPFYNASGAFGEITHKNFFTFETFTYLTREKNAISNKPRIGAMITDKFYEIIELKGIPTKIGKYIPNIRIKRSGRTGLRDCLAYFIGELIEELHAKLKVEK